MYPDNLKKNLIDADKGTTLSWSQIKDEVDIIVSTLKEADQSLYDPLPTGRSVPPFNPSILPLSPPLKSGAIVPSSDFVVNSPVLVVCTCGFNIRHNQLQILSQLQGYLFEIFIN